MVYTLACDIVMLAEEEKGMRTMMLKLGRYLRTKGLTVNASKSKIMRFKKDGGRMRKVSWWWEGK